MPDDKAYYINNPIFLKYNRRFDFRRLNSEEYLKSVYVNERIVEVPFAIRCAAQLQKGQSVLDLGCSESTLPLQLASLGLAVTGFDFRPYPYDHPNLTFVQGDMLQLPFEDKTFQAVCCISTLEHVGLGFYKDPDKVKKADALAVQEVHRVLDNNGLFILTVPFGKAQTNSHQRIYDIPTLKSKLEGFVIEEQSFFIDSPKERFRSNSWVEVSSEEASKVFSSDKTNAVCLIKARVSS